MSIDDQTLRLARKLRITVDSEVDHAVRQLVTRWAQAWDEIHDAWAEAMMDLVAAAQDGAWPNPWVVARSEQATKALQIVTDEIIGLSDFTGVTVLDAVGKVLDVDDAMAAITASQVPAAHRLQLAAQFNRVDPIALNAIMRRTTEQITAATFDLAFFAQEQMRRVLVRGVAVGDNPRKAAREMLRRAEGAFNGGLTRALVIARTEILDAHRAAARGWRVANDDVCDGWVWSATLDLRTCPSCLAMHGTEHDVAEEGPQDHQQGRCAAIPKAKSWRELGIDLDEPASALPDAQAWFEGLSDAEKLQVMGPGRMAALNTGTPFHDLARRRTTPGWRDSWAPTPVRDLIVWN